MTIFTYNREFNPLGLLDDASVSINEYKLTQTSCLLGIYENLAAIYIFQFGKTQLEIMLDGRSQEDKFKEEWIATFNDWIDQLSSNKSFIKGILKLTVFNDDSRNAFFIENHLKGIINEQFELKVLMRNGMKRVYLKLPVLKTAV